jgi:AcrR family transcriptional regulator
MPRSDPAPEAAPVPRRYHHGDLRAALLEAAETELAAQGVERFSLRAVAKRAGVSHAAPAHHFGDANGLLTALAVEGYHRFLATQRVHEAAAPPGQPDRIVAAGQGYVAFATSHPALFRLMFASDRPDRSDPALQRAARAAHTHRLEQVAELHGLADASADPAARAHATALWATVHGLADLLQTGRARFLLELPPAERDAAIAGILRRAAYPVKK